MALLHRKKLAGVLVAVIAGALVSAPAAGAYPASGRATVTDPSQTHILRHGGSATGFSLLLPKGAHCVGDARHDGYRVFSYLIPHGVDPHTESFVTTLPSRWYGMYTESQYYMGFPSPGTGAISDIPTNFVWSRLSSDLLLSSGQEAARWDSGLACVSGHYAVENTWSATFEFKRSGSDPAGFTWDVISTPGTQPPSGGLEGWAIIAFGAAAIFLAVALMLGWLSRQRGGASKPEDPGPEVRDHDAPIHDGAIVELDSKRSLASSGE